MVWALVAQAALQIGSSYMQAASDQKLRGAQDKITSANVYSSNTVNSANAYAANLVRAAGNSFSAAQAALQNTLRSVGNQEKLYTFGQQYNAVEENQTRVIDSMVRGNLSAQLKGAAALGALRAQAAASGTGGSSRDIMRSVSALAQGAAATSAADNQQYVQFDTLLQKAGLLRSAANSMDVGQALPTPDYGVNVVPKAPTPINYNDFADSPAVTAVKGWIAGGGLNSLLSGIGGNRGVPTGGGAILAGDAGSGALFDTA